MGGDKIQINSDKDNSESQNKYWIGLVILLLANCVVYFPSLFHVARADQLTYLIQTSAFDHFFDKLAFSLSYNRNMFLSGGDQLLFRPIFFLLLSLEELFFGYNFIYWQMLGIIFHLILIGQLLRLFKAIAPNLILVLFLLNFSVTALSQEMVIWHHVNGYLLALILILQSLQHFISFLHFPQNAQRHLSLAVLFLTLGCLTYEFSILVNIVFVMFLLKSVSKEESRGHGLRKSVSLLCIPAVSYFVANFMDYFVHSRVEIFSKAIKFDGFILIKQLFATLNFFIQSLIFPVFIQINSGDKPMLYLPTREKFVYDLIANPFLSSLNLLLVCLCLIGLYRIVRFSLLNKNSELETFKKGPLYPIRSLSFILFWCYLLFVLLGRVSDRSFVYLTYQLHHFYPLALFLTMFLITFTSSYKNIEIKRFDHQKSLLFTILLMSIILNAWMSFQFNREMSAKYRSWGQLVSQLERFKNQHKKEPDFSFDIVENEAKRPVQIYIGQAKDENIKKGLAEEFLFRKYLKAKDSKYFLAYTNKEGLVVLKNGER